ncbi:MAG: G1 family glutamic endopeptidase [Pseudonocardiaceae bacterium]
MDLASALDELPKAHAAVLRLHRAGTNAAGIAAELGIEVEAVAPLLRVAEAKLARLLAAPDPSGSWDARAHDLNIDPAVEIFSKGRPIMTKQVFGGVAVHTFPLPPAGFDPLAASAEQLRRHGFPRRPDHTEMPDAATKWVRAFSRYPAFEHIAPEFKGLERRSGPNHRTEKDTRAEVNATSSNWSGSVLFIGAGDQFNWITGAWNVPHTYQSPATSATEYSSAWLGIDGDGSDDVMQAGTETDSDGNCYAWFEWFPNYSIAIDNFPVIPGDVVNLVLCATSTTTAWVSIGNLTSMQYTSFSFSAPNGTALVGNCAEAVVERPSVGGQLAELPRYGEVFFDDVTAYTANGLSCPIGIGTPISMVADDNSTVISTPTFEADTDSIKVAYTGP